MPTRKSIEDVHKDLQDHGIKLIAGTFVDNAGITRVKTVPIYKLESALRKGIGISTLFSVFAVDDHIASSEGFDTPSGDMRLFLDPDAMIPLASSSGWAWAPTDQHDQEGQVLPVCQRSLLKRCIDSAASQGISFRMAYETEFSLIQLDDSPAHMGPGYSPWALLPAEDFAVELVDALESQSITIEQFHPEYSMGQYELSLSPQEPLKAADQYVLLRITIRRLARKYGYLTSFAPVVFEDAVGNGCHVHFSGWRNGNNLMSGGSGLEDLTAEGASLVGGVRQYLPELTAIYAPSVLSYERLQPGHWAGAFNCWGWENREAALRLVKGTRGARDEAANFELKSVDGTSNPYLASAAIIASAIEGLAQGLTLPTPIQIDPAALSEKEREEFEFRRLPTTLEESIKELEQSNFARQFLGNPLFEAFLAVRQLEWNTYGQKDISELTNIHRWKYG